MENYRVGTLEDRAYQAAVFFENITINSLKEIILDVGAYRRQGITRRFAREMG